MFTLLDLDALDRAIASGELEITIDGRRTVFRSADDLLKLRAAIVSALAIEAGTGVGYRLASTRKGV